MRVFTDPWSRPSVGLDKFVHYVDVIMGAMASQITGLTIVYSIVYSSTDQRKHQSSASQAFVCREFTGDRWILRTKGQLHRKCFHLMTLSCKQTQLLLNKDRRNLEMITSRAFWWTKPSEFWSKFVSRGPFNCYELIFNCFCSCITELATIIYTNDVPILLRMNASSGNG